MPRSTWLPWLGFRANLPPVGREGKRLWRGERWLARPGRTGETPLGEAGTEHCFGQRLQEIFLCEHRLQIIRQWRFKLHQISRHRLCELEVRGVQELPFERDAFEDAARPVHRGPNHRVSNGL